MGGPRSFYLLASTILAIGVGMAFMDDSDTVDRASRHTAKPSVQAAPPSTQGVPASRDRATIGDPEPERRTEVASLTTGRSEADEIAGVAAEAPPQAALKAQAIAAEPPASAGAEKEAKPATRPAVHRSRRKPAAPRSRRVVVVQRAEPWTPYAGAAPSATAFRMVMPGPDGYVRY